ncbi:MAG: DNA polymerase III subunit delta [Pararhodobacter sp.]
MKLAPRNAAGFLNRPDPAVPGILIHGADPMRVAEKRRTLVAALMGPQGEAEMRLTRLAGADLRKDPAAVLDALKAQGFFPGPRVVLVEDATDGTTETLGAALSDWAAGDGMLVVTAGTLNAGSKLRKLFEGDRSAFCLAVYDDPPDRAEIETWLRDEGLSDLPADTLRDLVALAQTLEPGDFRQTLTRIALYKFNDPEPLSPAEVALLAPQGTEAAIDELLHAVAEGRKDEVPGLVARLAGQGVAPVALCLGTRRHFRLLHRLTADPRGPAQAVGTLRPPVFGPRRDRLLRQAQCWSAERVETALGELTTTDLSLRSSTRAPLQALMERCLIRLASMAAQRR